MTKEKLYSEAQATGFRPEILEKVIQLLNLLEAFQGHPFLQGRLVLKGGTALNLFYFDVPRLSVDIDLNYIGAVSRETMLEERPKLEEAVQAVCSREGFTIRRLPTDHAGAKWQLRYESSIGQPGNLEVDLNFMFRVPLWPISLMDSKQVGSYQATAVPILDIHEIAAGKIAALLARQASRDLFDAHLLLTQQELDPRMLRLAFVVYGAMNRVDWRSVSIDNVNFNARELENSLIPVLAGNALGGNDIHTWTNSLVDECRAALSVVLPLAENEREFLDGLLDRGRIDPSLLTDDPAMTDRINSHPLLAWKALNVKQQNSI
ncbi:MAG: nucleotidyl transferase AbiEii/AbiGii toxin family protein [Proteobacteria bacterium]|nr:nucleotidyl transferase AbiEii/AbiGii toxin family protein [Pseudomonadota bacterium]MBU1688184.1 nucleotidyl transferase AbiEii/AbiGii toxin family protein [Pseudomonadota bacterium]